MGDQGAIIKNKRGSLVRILALILLPAVVYANTLRNSFQYDDTYFILNNIYTHSLSGIGHFFVSPRLISNIPLSGYRPLTMATFALNYIASGDNAFGYHLVNVAIHVLNTLILYAAALVIMRSFAVTRIREVALAVALLFACHPINTQPVNYISARSTLLAGGFSLLCVLLYVCGHQPALIRGHDAASCPRIKETSRGFFMSEAKNLRRTLLLGSLAAYLCALLSKEEAVAVPGLLALYEVSRFRLRFDKEKMRQIALGLAPFAALTVGFMLFVIKILGVIGETQQPRGIWENLFTQARAIFIYFRLMAAPTGLSIDHVVAASGSILDPATIAAVVAVIVLFGGSLFLIRVLPIVPFGLWWFLFALAPSSTLVALKLVVNEQRMYLPAVGVMFIMGSAFGAALERTLSIHHKGWRNALICGFSAILVILSALTVHRNADWRSPLSLWTNALKRYPDSARANTQMANLYLGMGKLEEALQFARKAAELASDTPEALIALANAYSRLGRQQEALVEARAAVSLNAASADAQTTLGVVYARLGRYEEAEAAWKRALELDPQNAEARENLQQMGERRKNKSRVMGRESRARETE